MTLSMTSKDKTAPARAPVVERVAGWSAKHRIVVVVGWLLLVVAAFTVGQRFGVTNTSDYDPGQAGQADERERQQRHPARDAGHDDHERRDRDDEADHMVDEGEPGAR